MGRHLRHTVALLAMSGGLVWGLAAWQLELLYINQVTTSLVDPMLGFDSGFYLYTFTAAGQRRHLEGALRCAEVTD